jgi:metallo-beta-lactamase family protein
VTSVSSVPTAQRSARSSVSPTLTFLGAIRTVTGSRFLVETGDSRVLVDCGLYQGLRDLRRRNWAHFPVDPGSLDAVVLTHAHLDHSGYLPVLVRDGFAGRIHTTPATASLAEIVLLDSAHVQEEDARYAARKGFSRHKEPQPLYTSADAEATLPRLAPQDFGEPVEVASGVSVTLRPAGHILGSATAEIRFAGGERVLFSGDLGRPDHPLLQPPAPPVAADAIVVESTYGDRAHDDATIGDFASAVRRTAERGGSVLIPAFAVDRTEVLLHHLRRLMRAGEIPRLPVFVDSPMALATLDVYRSALAAADPSLRPGLGADGDPFDPGGLHELVTVEESMSVNDPKLPCIVISASGMATGGRVLHHLRHMLPDPKHTVVLAGYQAEGTRGRSLLDGAREIKLLGRYVPVRADVVDAPAFSVHADADELVGWLRSAPQAPDAAYVVHGEAAASFALRDRIARELGWTAVVPRERERVRLD